MLAYLLRRTDIHRTRHEVYVPEVGVLWPELRKLREDKGYIDDIKRVLKRIINEGEGDCFYTLLGEKEIPESLVNEYVGWINSRKISNEGIEEAGNKIIKKLEIPELFGD